MRNSGTVGWRILPALLALGVGIVHAGEADQEERAHVRQRYSHYLREKSERLPRGKNLVPAEIEIRVDRYPNSERIKTFTPVNRDGQIHGLVVTKVQYGHQALSTVPYVEGVREGIERNYAYTKIDGKLVWYVEKEIPWKNDVVEGIRKTFYPTGEIASEVKYVAGKAHGESRSFAKNGQPLRVGRFVAGVREGEMIDYWPPSADRLESGEPDPDPPPKKILQYKNGEVNGLAKEFHRSGKLRREIPCVEGAFHGVQVEYDEAGKVVEKRYWIDDEEVSKNEFKYAAQGKE